MEIADQTGETLTTIGTVTGLAPIAALGKGLEFGAKTGKFANGTFGLDEGANVATMLLFGGTRNTLTKNAETVEEKNVVRGFTQIINDIVNFITDKSIEESKE